ncbi:15 kDa selenoprotein [Mizuhopecten yessoensis]|uniref:Selenoprotein F n=1 Tax=Mizuhopecten yessoensis TaxID=6573 RepID=A0A210PSN7_MIZYE|nr:15 kDa selenoprotein [Mizuhopecten yessoensis]
MADPLCLLSLVFVLLLYFDRGKCSLTLEKCNELGFNTGLMCSMCRELGEFNLNPLEESCLACCDEDSDSGSDLKTFPFAELHHIDMVPNVEGDLYPAFVKSDRVKQFPGLNVRYVRGADPIIKLLNEKRDVVETLGIDKWNTDSVEAFFKERLRK